MKHAEGEQEHTLCGFAFDAYDTKDTDDPVIFASPGEVVDCPDCRRAIDFIRRNYQKYKYLPKQ